MLRLFFIFFGFLFSEIAFSQSNPETISYSKLIKYKVDENRFDLGWPNTYRQILCFSDYTNLNLQSRIIDPKNDSVIYTSKEPEQYGLKIVPDKITIDKKSRTFQISGQITGGWEGASEDEFEIYVGYRIDSFSNITISPSLHHITRYYNGVKVDSTIVIATIPAFYLINFKRFNADRRFKNLSPVYDEMFFNISTFTKSHVYSRTKNLGNSNNKEMLFNISTVIDEKSILVFGLSSTYVEIFEIGKLLTQ